MIERNRMEIDFSFFFLYWGDRKMNGIWVNRIASNRNKYYLFIIPIRNDVLHSSAQHNATPDKICIYYDFIISIRTHTVVESHRSQTTTMIISIFFFPFFIYSFTQNYVRHRVKFDLDSKNISIFSCFVCFYEILFVVAVSFWLAPSWVAANRKNMKFMTHLRQTIYLFLSLTSMSSSSSLLFNRRLLQHPSIHLHIWNSDKNCGRGNERDKITINSIGDQWCDGDKRIWQRPRRPRNVRSLYSKNVFFAAIKLLPPVPSLSLTTGIRQRRKNFSAHRTQLNDTKT